MQNLFCGRGLKLLVFGRGLLFFGRRHVSVIYSSLQRRLTIATVVWVVWRPSLLLTSCRMAVFQPPARGSTPR